MTYRKNDRDANERDIIRALRAVGCIVRQMDRHAGFDLLVVSPFTGIHIVEVKNPAYKWHLTENEQDFQGLVESAGETYWIIDSVEAAMKMIDR